MEIPDDEVERWRAALLDDRKRANRDLDGLARTDRARLVELCHHLARDPSLVVRRDALIKLGRWGDRDDEFAQQLALDALQVPELRHMAFFALGRVGTPAVFNLLLSQAAAGIPAALAAVSEQVRSPQEREQVLTLARDSVLSRDGQLRDEAVQVLVRHSSAPNEEGPLLTAGRLYTDEFVLDALSGASSDVLPDLRELLAAYSPASMEHRLIARTIQAIEQRAHLT